MGNWAFPIVVLHCYIFCHVHCIILIKNRKIFVKEKMGMKKKKKPNHSFSELEVTIYVKSLRHSRSCTNVCCKSVVSYLNTYYLFIFLPLLWRSN